MCSLRKAANGLGRNEYNVGHKRSSAERKVSISTWLGAHYRLREEADILYTVCVCACVCVRVAEKRKRTPQRCIKRVHLFTVMISGYYQLPEWMPIRLNYSAVNWLADSWPVTVSFTQKQTLTLLGLISFPFLSLCSLIGSRPFFFSPNLTFYFYCLQFFFYVYSNLCTLVLVDEQWWNLGSHWQQACVYVYEPYCVYVHRFGGRAVKAAGWSILMFIDRKINGALIQDLAQREEAE